MKEKTGSLDGIIIIGSREFIKYTKQAMILLRKKAPTAYRSLVLRYLTCIKSHDFTGTIQDGTFFVGKKTSSPRVGLAWFASTLVHEAVHLDRASKGLPFIGTDEERTEAEKACNQMQAGIGAKIGLSEREITYLRSLDGTHWKLPRNW